MEKKSQTILQEALKLPSNERAAVAEQLIQSLDPVQETDVEQAWQQEIQRRLTEMKNGEADFFEVGVRQKDPNCDEHAESTGMYVSENDKLFVK